MLVLPVNIESGIEWAVLDADSLEIVPLRSVDPLRPVAHVRANGVEIGVDRLLSKVSQAAGRAIATSQPLSAEAVGIARWATDTASEYAKIREQFGRPIGQFQAIKHQVRRDDRGHRAGHRGGVWDAVRAIDEAAEQDWDNAATHYEFAAAVAATLAPTAAQRCTQDCIQVHGGIGFTWEHDTNVTTGTPSAGRRLPGARTTTRSGCSTPRRPPGCGHWTSTSTPDTEKLRSGSSRSRCAQGDSARRAQGRHRRGRLGSPTTCPGLGGREATPVEQIIISQEFSSGRVKSGPAWASPHGSSRRSSPSAPTSRSNASGPPTFRGEMI